MANSTSVSYKPVFYNKLCVHCIFCFILNPRSLSITCSHLFSFFIPPVVIPCYLLSFVLSLFVTCCLTRCHSLCHSLLFVVTSCPFRHSFYYSLSFVVFPCHLLLLVLPLIIIRCTTLVSFYKR